MNRLIGLFLAVTVYTPLFLMRESIEWTLLTLVNIFSTVWFLNRKLAENISDFFKAKQLSKLTMVFLSPLLLLGHLIATTLVITAKILLSFLITSARIITALFHGIKLGWTKGPSALFSALKENSLLQQYFEIETTLKLSFIKNFASDLVQGVLAEQGLDGQLLAPDSVLGKTGIALSNELTAQQDNSPADKQEKERLIAMLNNPRDVVVSQTKTGELNFTHEGTTLSTAAILVRLSKLDLQLPMGQVLSEVADAAGSVSGLPTELGAQLQAFFQGAAPTEPLGARF